jgi:hypothetical protein
MSTKRGHAPKRHWRSWRKEMIRHQEQKERYQREKNEINQMINEYRK